MVGVPDPGADFCVSFGASITRDFVHGAIREARYCFCFNNFVEDLKKEKRELLNCEESIRERAKKARENAKKIEDEVKQWLDDADTYKNEVDELVKKAEKSKSCSPGNYPNWICRCLVARQLAKKKKDIRQHNETTKNFKNFACLASLPRMGYFSSENFMKFDSRKLVHEQLLKELKDDKVSMIGLHGMAGCGKTTLAKEVGKEAEQFFNKVVFVVVSRNYEVRSIQNKIAGWLEHKFNEEEETQRAKRLSILISNNEKILIILDDIWGKLDFGAIGIPFGENRKGCKVLMTTRYSSVCDLMDCQKAIFLSLLSFEESLALFQKHAHIADDTFDALKDVAEEITEKCSGLPVAIAAIASTLKGKPRVKWEVALKTLKESRPMDIEEGLQNPYTCLQLSYENLKCREAKSLFLLCSAFPEDMKIDVEALTKFGIGLGLFGKVSSYAMARKQVIAAKHELINACLLLEDEDDKANRVKMHDLVRDVALYVAKGEIKVIKGNDRNGNAFEEDLSTLKGNRVRYLWCDKFPNQLSCSKLEFLYVRYESETVEITGGVFENLKKLRVLALDADKGIGKIPQLPKSTEKLTNLRCLFLANCELGHISFLGSMKGLESLTLNDCTFLELPDAISHLKKLKLLHVIECEIERSPYEVIGRCLQLEELYFIENNCSEWSYGDETAAKFLEKFNAPQALQRYLIEIGALKEASDIPSGPILNTLVIEYFVASISNSILKDLVKRAEVLCLGHIKGDCNSIVPDVYQKVGGMTELIELELHNSEEIKYLIDNIERQCNAETVFSNLSKLLIRKMHCLEALCHGLPSPVLFKKLEKICICECSQLHGVLFIGKLNLCNLQVLELRYCPKLTSIFTADSVRSLSQLQDLKIHGCSELKHIITEEVKEEIIEYSDQRTKQLPFQKLKRLFVSGCKQLKYMVPVSYAHGLLQLESMEIIAVDELRFLFGQRNHANQLVEHAKSDFQIKLPVLKLLKLSGLPNIVSIFPENYYPVWPSLHELYLYKCPKFAITSLNTCVVESEVKQHCDPTKEMDPLLVPSNHKSDGISHVQILLDIEKLTVAKSNIQSIFQVAGLSLDIEFAPSLTLHLKSLNLEDLHELSYICKGPIQIMSLRDLVQLEIYGCGKLKSIFSTCSMESMPHLEKLSINRCNQLEQIIANEEHHNIMNTGTESCPRSTSNCYTLLSGSLDLCNLKHLRLYHCPMLKSLFTLSTVKTLRSLENLTVYECHVLKEIINCESPCECKREESGFQIHFSILFPKLKKLNIGKCDSLECIFPIPFNQGLMELKYISIWNAPQLQYLFGEGSLEHHSSHQYQNIILIKLPVLEEMTLKGLPNLIGICPNNYYTVCPSLQKILLNHVRLSIPTSNILKGGSEDTQWDYISTKEIGPLIIHGDLKSDDMSRSQTLLDIETLNVTKSNIKSIFQVAGLPLNTELALPLTLRLKSLSLENLYELDYIFKCSIQMMSLQNLVALHISGCGKIKSIFSACSFISLPQLEDLWIRDCYQLEQIIAHEEYQNIMKTSIESCSNSISNSSTLHSGSLDLCNLKQLNLYDCPMLKSLFTLSTVMTLRSLENLTVFKCHVLKEIIICESPCGYKKEESGFQSHSSIFSILFPKLKNLRIELCNSLECIFPVPFNQCLMELKNITILKAPQLQYLFGEGSLEHQSSHQYQNIIQIKLPVLEELRLEELPNLISICSNNYYIVCPSLQKIVLNHVRLSVPTSNILKDGSKDTQWDYNSIKDLGATIMKLLQNSDVGNSNSDEHFIGKENDLLLLREMRLLNQQEIKYLCISPKRLLDLQNLLQLTIKGCEKLKAMFSVSVLTTLPQLKEIIIKDCEELEQITIEEQQNENMPNPYSQKGCFPQLKVLLIKHCNKLKRLFSISTSREFPKLECIIIKEASQLKEVFESEKGEIEERKEVVLPQLKYLILVQLPSLTNVCQGIEFQTVRNRVVQNCPNLSLTTALQKSIQQLEEKIIGSFGDTIYLELRDILESATIETFNEDPMVESRVSDSEDKAASESEPASSQIIKEKGKRIVGNGSASRTPAIATSSTDVHESMDEHSTSELTLHSQQLASGETKRTTKGPQEPSIPFNQSVEAISHETAEESLTSKEAIIATLSDDIALPIGSLPKVSVQDTEVVLNENAQKGPIFEEDAIVTLSNDLKQRNLPSKRPLVIDPLLKSSHLGVANGVQEGLAIEKVNVVASSSQDTEVVLKENAQKGPIFEEDAIVTLSNDLKQRNLPSKGPLVIDPLLKSSHLGVANGVQEGLAIEKAKTVASSSQELVKRDSMRKPILMEQQAIGDREVTNDAPNMPSDLAKYAMEPENNSASKVASEEITMQTSLIVSKLKNSSLHPSDSSLNKIFPQNTEIMVKESTQEGLSFEEAIIATLSNALAPRNSPPAGSLVIGPLQREYLPGVVDGVQEGLPIEKAKPVASSSQIILMEQQATEGNDITNDPSNSLLDLAQNEPKLKISSLCPSVALSDKTFSQISSNLGLSPFSSTSTNLLAELSTKSRVDKFSTCTFLEPGLLQGLKTKLTQYFNMPLEAIFETNTLDDVESIVNSLAKGTTDVIQKNILEDLKSRLKQFKECVPKAINTMESSLGFMSNYKSLNVELNAKLSEGQEKLRDLEYKMSKTHAKEYAIDMEIQQLFAQKIEILEQRKSLASQLNQSSEAVFTDYVKWKALGENLKVSTQNWLKSKEDLAHANASWKLFKESLAL